MSIAPVTAPEIRSDCKETVFCGTAFPALVAISSPGKDLDPELFQDIDWQRLLFEARHHQLMPMLAHRVLEAGIRVSADVRNALRQEFQSNLLRNFGFFEEIKRILTAWQESGVEAIPYKGPVMAEQLWGSFALRECSDLDFFVRRCDAKRAGEILRKLGYEYVDPLEDHLRPAFLKNASEEQFRHSASSILLELQWAPAPRTMAVSYDAEHLWRNRISMSAAGQDFIWPSPEDLFGMLAIHGWKHNWSKLIWVADLAVLMGRHDIDWTQLSESAVRNGWRKIFLLAVEMVRRIYGTAVPGSPVETDHDLRLLAEDLETNLHAAKTYSYLDWHRHMLRARDSRFGRVKQLAAFVFTPGLAEYGSIKLPVWGASGYRALRLKRIVSLCANKLRA